MEKNVGAAIYATRLQDIIIRIVRAAGDVLDRMGATDDELRRRRIF